MENIESLKSGLENDQVDSPKTEFFKDSETEHSPNSKPKWEYSSEWDEETLSRLASEFPHVEGLTYLDHAASTLYSKSQVDAVSRELTPKKYSPLKNVYPKKYSPLKNPRWTRCRGSSPPPWWQTRTQVDEAPS